MDPCRLSDVAFDVASSAGWYWQSPASCRALRLLQSSSLWITTATRTERETGHAVVVFICAFFSLLVLSLTYAILAGRTGGGAADGIAAHEQMVNGAAFGLSVLLLLFGLRAVLGAYGKNRHVFDSARSLVLVVTSILGPAVLLALQFSNALDVERYRQGSEADAACGPSGMPAGVWINLAITAVALLAVLGLALARTAPAEMGGGAGTDRQDGPAGLTIAFVGWSPTHRPPLPTAVVAGAVFEHLAVAVTAALTVAFAAASWLGRWTRRSGSWVLLPIFATSRGAPHARSVRQ